MNLAKIRSGETSVPDLVLEPDEEEEERIAKLVKLHRINQVAVSKSEMVDMANSKVTVPYGPRDEVEQEPIIFKGHTRVAKLLVMDRLTKYAYFIATKNTDTAEDTAKRLFACVFSIHGVCQ